MAHVLVDHGASVLLAGRSRDALAALAAELPGSHPIVAADLTTTAGRQQLTRAAAEFHPNVLVNNAGASEFALLTSQDPAGIEALLDVNLVAPIHLCRDFLGLLEPGAAPKAHIVNVGSVLGAIGHPGYAVYGASKAGLHGFTQALRRELADRPIQVHHLAPRATRTQIHSPQADRLNAALGNAVDPPERVAGLLLRALTASRGRDWTIGWPERALVYLNAITPSIVDRALARRLATIRAHANG